MPPPQTTQRQYSQSTSTTVDHSRCHVILQSLSPHYLAKEQWFVPVLLSQIMFYFHSSFSEIIVSYVTQ